jgi:tRNA-splicing endonuclease subunit Sen34
LHTKTYTQIPTKHPFALLPQLVLTWSTSNEAKYRVFKDLWNKGLYITSGDSFGSDFLSYPGDPFHYHASQIVHVVDPNARLEISYIVSCARLSVTVKKACVFAYPNDNDTITYQTLSWDNPKLRDLYGLNPESKAIDES